MMIMVVDWSLMCPWRIYTIWATERIRSVLDKVYPSKIMIKVISFFLCSSLFKSLNGYHRVDYSLFHLAFTSFIWVDRVVLPWSVSRKIRVQPGGEWCSVPSRGVQRLGMEGDVVRSSDVRCVSQLKRTRQDLRVEDHDTEWVSLIVL